MINSKQKSIAGKRYFFVAFLPEQKGKSGFYEAIFFQKVFEKLNTLIMNYPITLISKTPTP